MNNLLDLFTRAWLESASLQFISEALLISMLVFAVFLLLDRLSGTRLSSQSRYLLILAGFVSAFLSLLLSQIHWSLSSATSTAPSLVTLIVRPGMDEAPVQDWGAILASLYLMPVGFLVARLLYGLGRLQRMRTSGESVAGTVIDREVAQLSRLLKLSRSVTVRTSDHICSPFSFGAKRPTVLLPKIALQWSPQTLRHVLAHELCHVQRGDWLCKLLCYLLASALWMNPLSWRLLRRLDACAESACDMQAASLISDNADYASTLLSVARLCQPIIGARYAFAQSMLDRSTLETRIVRLLEEKTMKTIELEKERRNVMISLALFALVLAVTLTNTQMVSAQPQSDDVERRGEFLPLNSIEPVYPRVAAEQGIEGWVQVKFTVGTDGLVIADTVELVDAEPVGVFDNSAINAAKKFRFTQYAPDGFPVMVPNVQYVFRFAMHD
jgi:bla regulator protein BlaR1